MKRVFSAGRQSVKPGWSQNSEYSGSSISSSVPGIPSAAECMFKKLMAHIADFERSLNPDQEVGASMVSFGDKPFYISGIGYHGNDMIIFYGATPQGQPVKLMQHVTQTNVTEFEALQFSLQVGLVNDPVPVTVAAAAAGTTRQQWLADIDEAIRQAMVDAGQLNQIGLAEAFVLGHRQQDRILARRQAIATRFVAGELGAVYQQHVVSGLRQPGCRRRASRSCADDQDFGPFLPLTHVFPSITA